MRSFGGKGGLTQSINNEGVYRTAPATPGLLNMTGFVLNAATELVLDMIGFVLNI